MPPKTVYNTNKYKVKKVCTGGYDYIMEKKSESPVPSRTPSRPSSTRTTREPTPVWMDNARQEYVPRLATASPEPQRPVTPRQNSSRSPAAERDYHSRTPSALRHGRQDPSKFIRRDEESSTSRSRSRGSADVYGDYRPMLPRFG